jgi:hypothetical protein
LDSTWTQLVRSARQAAGFRPRIAKSQKRVKTKRRIRITRSILLRGEHAEKGEIREVEKSLAADLIACGSAVPIRTVWWAAVAVCLAIGVAAVLWLSRVRGWW